jgi:hypothetical protein
MEFYVWDSVQMINVLTNYYFKFEPKKNLWGKYFIIVGVDIPTWI